MRTAITALAVLWAAGCGGHARPSSTVTTTETDSDPVADVADDRDPDSDDDGVELVSDRGRFEPEVAAAKFAPHATAFDACYRDQLARRRWLGGGVEMTWSVAADGKLESVHLGASDLGAWPIEKCLLAVARQVDFGKPDGHGKAAVTFPVQFAGGSGALAWDSDQAERAVASHRRDLAACAKTGGGDPANVTVTVYVGTRGAVQSVGFAAPLPLADAWGDCAAAKVSAWTLTDPRGKVAKLSFVYHPVATDDDSDRDDDQD
jgi:hypothetical protein